jgi:hypothetical protein
MGKLIYEILGTAQAAQALGVSDARVRQLLGAGRIVGAKFVSGVWLVPARRRAGVLHVAVTPGARGPKPKGKQ